MKKLGYLLLVTLLTGCINDDDDIWWGEQFTEYEPVLIRRADLATSVTFEDARPLRAPGKIYTTFRYLFVNERHEGVHVIDNFDRENPQNVGFIAVPGCADMAVKDGVLYVDNLIDLVAIDLSDPTAPRVVSRIPDAFPNPNSTPPDGGVVPEEFRYENLPEGTVIFKWIKK